MSGKENLPKLPFSVGNRAAYINTAAVAIELVQVPTLRTVVYSVPRNRVEVSEVPVSRVSTDHNTKDQYYVDGGHVMGGPSAMAKTHLSWLRSRALESGATPEAVRLLARATGSFKKSEEKEMAEKLKAKAPKAANKDELKAAAKSTPVGKGAKPAPGTAPARKGNNADNLAKARAARAQKGPDNRKVTGLVKAKDLAARPGSYRHTMLTNLLNSKTVQEFRDKGHTAGDLAYATKAGIVKVA